MGSAGGFTRPLWGTQGWSLVLCSARTFRTDTSFPLHPRALVKVFSSSRLWRKQQRAERHKRRMLSAPRTDTSPGAVPADAEPGDPSFSSGARVPGGSGVKPRERGWGFTPMMPGPLAPPHPWPCPGLSRAQVPVVQNKLLLQVALSQPARQSGPLAVARPRGAAGSGLGKTLPDPPGSPTSAGATSIAPAPGIGERGPLRASARGGCKVGRPSLRGLWAPARGSVCTQAPPSVSTLGLSPQPGRRALCAAASGGSGCSPRAERQSGCSPHPAAPTTAWVAALL